MIKNAKVLSVLLVSSLLLSACSAQAPKATSESLDSTAPVGEETLSASLKDIMVRGGSVKCTFSFNDTEAKTESRGTIYAAGKKFFQEAEVRITGDTAMNTKMRMVSDGTTMYSWNQDKKDPGMKMKIDETATSTESETSEQTASSIDKKMDMKCSPWVVDESKFAIPTDINFLDLTELMPSKMPGVPSGIPGYSN